MKELIHFFTKGKKVSISDFMKFPIILIYILRQKHFQKKCSIKPCFLAFVYNNGYSSFDSIRYVVLQLSLVSLYRPAMKFLVNF